MALYPGEHLSQAELDVASVAEIVHVSEVGVVVSRLEGRVLEVVPAIDLHDIVHRRPRRDIQMAATDATNDLLAVDDERRTRILVSTDRAVRVHRRFPFGAH